MGWSQLARRYDWQLPLERAALVAAIDLADAKHDDVVLDVGTGTGGLLRELARRPDRPRSAVGVDSSAAMLSAVPALSQDWSLEKADARELRFADGTFSLVTAAYLLHVVDAPARRQIISEVRRVLDPSGRFVAVTPTCPRTRLGRRLYSAFAGADDSPAGPSSALRPLDPRPELEAAQFTITDSRHVSRGYPSICVLAAR